MKQIILIFVCIIRTAQRHPNFLEVFVYCYLNEIQHQKHFYLDEFLSFLPACDVVVSACDVVVLVDVVNPVTKHTFSIISKINPKMNCFNMKYGNFDWTRHSSEVILRIRFVLFLFHACRKTVALQAKSRIE